MSLQGMLGGLMDQVTGNNHQAEEGKEAEASSGLLGAAVSALGGAQLAERLNQATSLLAPEQKSELAGGLLGKLGVSGTGAQALLQQLGINPNVANNPHEATPEELSRLAQHAENNSESNNDSGEDSSEASDADSDADNDNNAEAKDSSDDDSDSDDDTREDSAKN